jgi:putative peptide zinc metalloprotease protein
MPVYTRDTVVNVEPFTRQREGTDIIIGRAETGVFLAVPPEAVELLEDLADGKCVGQVADLYQKRHGELPDLDEFLGFMEAKGIVTLASGSQGSEKNGIARTGQAPPSKVRYHFTNIPQSFAQLLFGRSALIGSAVLVAVALALIVRDPSITPRPRDLYFADHRTLIWMILIVVGYAAVFIHELGHLIAARALGINSRMGISHRLWHVVAETDLTGLWAVPKRQRYLPLFAGAIIDAASGALLFLIVFAQSRHWLALPALVLQVIRALSFTYVMRIIWQCLLFIRTDFYYVIASLFNCRSLLSDTEDFLRNLVARAIPWVRKVDQTGIPSSEQKVIRVYAVVWILGRIVALYLLSVVTIPLFVRYSISLGAAVRAGYSANPGNFIDAIMFTFYFLMPVSLGLTLWIRSLIRGERT